MNIKSVCNTCGMTLNEKASFCPTCGSRMNIIEVQPENANYEENPQTQNPQPEIQSSGNPALDAAMNNGNPSFDSENIPPVTDNIPPVPPTVKIVPPIPHLNINGSQPNKEAKNGKDTVALVGMILSIISVVLCCLNLLDLPIAIAGLILGIVGINSVRSKGMAIAAIVCSSIAIVLCISIFCVGLSAIEEGGSIYNDIESIFDDGDDDIWNYEYHYNWD